MPSITSLTLKSDLNELDRVVNFVRQLADKCDIDQDTEHRILLVLSEAVTNAIVHGNRKEISKTVNIKVVFDQKTIFLTVCDQGSGFDPDRIPDPRTKENLLKTGGRGVWLIQEIADETQYSENGTRIDIRINL
ncbi:MAG: ATP-binding protein [Balneolales bacterium]